MTQSHALPQARSLTACAQPKRSMLTGVSSALALWRSRRALARMEAHELADIGVTQAQARQESRRPFWDAAPHWTE